VTKFRIPGSGDPLKRGHEIGVSLLKCAYLTAIGSYSVLLIITNTGDELYTCVNSDDLERP